MSYVCGSALSSHVTRTIHLLARDYDDDAVGNESLVVLISCKMTSNVTFSRLHVSWTGLRRFVHDASRLHMFFERSLRTSSTRGSYS